MTVHDRVRLALLAGFENKPCDAFGGALCEDGHWLSPEGKVFYGSSDLPDFPKDVKACFRWIVPLFEPLGYDFEISNDLEALGWRVSVGNTKSGCSIASPYVDLDEPAPEKIASAICELILIVSKERAEGCKDIRSI